MQDRLFDIPPIFPKKTKKRPWHPSKDQTKILEVLRKAPADSAAIFIALDCALKRSTIDSHLESLARRGVICDTGERGEWSVKGRRWVYRMVES